MFGRAVLFEGVLPPSPPHPMFGRAVLFEGSRHGDGRHYGHRGPLLGLLALVAGAGREVRVHWQKALHGEAVSGYW